MTVRTYNARRGRLSDHRLDVLERLGAAYGLALDVPMDAGKVFGRRAPLVLEIGSGMGEATVAMAMADPARDHLAVEVHTAGVANLLELIDQLRLANVRVVRGDAIEWVRDCLPPASLDAVHVYFPDPWPKARHHKRRLVQPERVALLRSRLVVGGSLRCATDWSDYAHQMLATLSADPGLRNEADGFARRPPERPVTGYERRAITAGRTVFDLAFCRVDR